MSQLSQHSSQAWGFVQESSADLLKHAGIGHSEVTDREGIVRERQTHVKPGVQFAELVVELGAGESHCWNASYGALDVQAGRAIAPPWPGPVPQQGPGLRSLALKRRLSTSGYTLRAIRYQPTGDAASSRLGRCNAPSGQHGPRCQVCPGLLGPGLEALVRFHAHR